MGRHNRRCQITPKLYIGATPSKEDTRAEELLKKNQVPFQDLQIEEKVSSPSLRYGSRIFYGLSGIENFLRLWRQKRLPGR